MPLHSTSSNLSSCSRSRESDAPSRAEASSYFDLCSEAAPGIGPLDQQQRRAGSVARPRRALARTAPIERPRVRGHLLGL